jgi:hypothetical protein
MPRPLLHPHPAPTAIAVLVSLYLMGAMWMFSLPKRQPSTIGAAVPSPLCPVTVEIPGSGLACLSVDVARRLDLESGSLWFASRPAENSRRRMAPKRLLVAGIKLDINRASVEELVALPEIGEGLARAIATERARRPGPLRCQEDLSGIPGLGARRVRRILPFLQALQPTCSQTK